MESSKIWSGAPPKSANVLNTINTLRNLSFYSAKSICVSLLRCNITLSAIYHPYITKYYFEKNITCLIGLCVLVRD